MKLAPHVAAILLLWTVSGAHAQSDIGSGMGGSTTYRCVDSAGRSTYTNVKEEMGGKKCTVVSREVSVVPAQRPAAPPPAAARSASAAESGKGAAGATRIAPQTQRARDTDRRRILQEELDAAEKQLATARQKLSEQEAIRTGNERNYQRVLDRLKPFQDQVRGAEDNVAALKREMSNLR